MKNYWNTIKNFIKKSPVENMIIATFLIAIFYVLVPFDSLVKAESGIGDSSASLEVQAMINESTPYGKLPESGLGQAYRTVTVKASAYNSVPWQTDDTPFTTAAGTQVRHGVIAANFLPIGTKLTIPDLYGDFVFTVEDRMNPRYQSGYIDIWMGGEEGVPAARAFGRKTVEIHVYPK